MQVLDQTDRIIALLDRKRAGRPLTVQEEEELRLFEQPLVTAKFSIADEENPSVSAKEYIEEFLNYDYDKSWDKLKKRVFPTIYAIKSKGVSLYKMAATIIILAGLGTIVYLNWVKTEKKTDIAVEDRFHRPPLIDRAVLTLADGSKIVLDSSSTGHLAVQQGAEILKTEKGIIEYNPSGIVDEKETISYNTIAVPRGSLYSIRLPDKTKVWLNAGSSLRYPTVFTGLSRVVSLTGEGYFEVQEIEKEGRPVPFVVKTQEMDVEVQGTKFNINAYDHEPGVKTSLLEGAVRLIKGGMRVGLKAGQEGNLLKSNERFKVYPANVNQVTSWITGAINFSGDLKSLMRVVARKYDVDVSFEADAEIGRQKAITLEVPSAYSLVNLVTVLNGIYQDSEEGALYFSLQGGKVIVSKKD